MTYCKERLSKQQKINDLEEENVCLKKLRYQERTAKEGFFGSSTPSSKIPVKLANAFRHLNFLRRHPAEEHRPWARSNSIRSSQRQCRCWALDLKSAWRIPEPFDYLKMILAAIWSFFELIPNFKFSFSWITVYYIVIISLIVIFIFSYFCCTGY